MPKRAEGEQSIAQVVACRKSLRILGGPYIYSILYKFFFFYRVPSYIHERGLKFAATCYKLQLALVQTQALLLLTLFVRVSC